MTRLYFLMLLTALFGCTKAPVNHYGDTELYGQNPPPDVVFVEGKGKVPSFYVGVSEEPNVNYVTYLNWLKRVFIDYPEVHKNAIIQHKTSDAVVRFADPSLVYHMEHPAFSYYPIVGATWNQVQNYLQWKTDRVNEALLLELGILKWHDYQMNEENFNLESYLYGQYRGMDGKHMIPSENMRRETRNVVWQDGILLAGYRLPTEAEWEMLSVENKVHDQKGNFPFGKKYPTLRWAMDESVDNYDYTETNRKLPGYAHFWKHETLPNPNKIKDYVSGIQGPYISKTNAKPSNVAGNVREWLFDLYEEKPQTEWRNMQEFLWQNGYETRPENMQRIYDTDGVIDLKDQFGRLSFRILGVNSDGSPLWAIPTNSYLRMNLINYDTLHVRIDSKTVLYSTSFEGFYDAYKHYITMIYMESVQGQNYNPTLQVDLISQIAYKRQYHKHHPTSQSIISPDSLDKVVRFWSKQKWQLEKEKGLFALGLVTPIKFYKDATGFYTKIIHTRYYTEKNAWSESPRLIRGGTWQNPDFNYREGLHPDSSRTDIGFRCVLPYTSIPVKKKYLVDWR